MGRLVGAWFLVRAAPYSQWKGLLKQGGAVKSVGDLSPNDLAWLEDVQHVLRQVKRVFGDHATCLMMVLVARWMLNRRRLPGTIYLGVRRDATKPGLHAHAWMLSTIGVVGHEDVEPFAIVERIGA